MLTVIDSTGERTSTSTLITSGNTTPTITIESPVANGLFSFGDKLEFKVTVTDPEDPSIDCRRVNVKYVLGHDQHGHELQSVSGCRAVPADGRGRGVARRQRVRRDQRRVRRHGRHGRRPGAEDDDQLQLRQKRQEVELALSRSRGRRTRV